MYNELVKSLRELCEMTALCGEHSCFECPYEEKCSGYKNGILSAVYRLSADAIEELSKPKLIPVTERLPEKDGDYLVWFYDAKCWKVAEFSRHTAKERHVWWFAGIDRTRFVTHWMPLPTPPQAEEGE